MHFILACKTKKCIYCFFFLGACHTLHPRWADHRCNVRLLQTVSVAIYSYLRYRQAVQSKKLNGLQEHSLAPLQFIENCRLSVAKADGTCRHSFTELWMNDTAVCVGAPYSHDLFKLWQLVQGEDPRARYHTEGRGESCRSRNMCVLFYYPVCCLS